MRDWYGIQFPDYPRPAQWYCAHGVKPCSECHGFGRLKSRLEQEWVMAEARETFTDLEIALIMLCNDEEPWEFTWEMLKKALVFDETEEA